MRKEGKNPNFVRKNLCAGLGGFGLKGYFTKNKIKIRCTKVLEFPATPFVASAIT
jgi:hypothetical protein